MVYRQPSLIRQLCLKILALILTGLQPGVRQRKNERNRFNGLLPSSRRLMQPMDFRQQSERETVSNGSSSNTAPEHRAKAR
jgi:hypothetical protein